MAILTKDPPQPSSLNQVANWISASLALRLLRIISGSERGRMSESLRRALRASTRGRGIASVWVPHYWAPFYHDGRGPTRAKPGKWLVWFKDPGDDPRWGPGLPVLRRQVRRLTPEEFAAGLEENKRRGPGNPFMIVTKRSPFPTNDKPGTSRGSGGGIVTKQNPFFERGLDKLVLQLDKEEVRIADTLGDILDRKLRHSKQKPFIRQRARLRI